MVTYHLAAAHGGNRPFKCKICEQRFVFEKFLKKHILQVHEGKKNFKSVKKNELLKSKLNEHIEVVHEGIKKQKMH